MGIPSMLSNSFACISPIKSSTCLQRLEFLARRLSWLQSFCNGDCTYVTYLYPYFPNALLQNPRFRILWTVGPDLQRQTRYHILFTSLKCHSPSNQSRHGHVCRVLSLPVPIISFHLHKLSYVGALIAWTL